MPSTNCNLRCSSRPRIWELSRGTEMTKALEHYICILKFPKYIEHEVIDEHKSVRLPDYRFLQVIVISDQILFGTWFLPLAYLPNAARYPHIAITNPSNSNTNPTQSDLHPLSRHRSSRSMRLPLCLPLASLRSIHHHRNRSQHRNARQNPRNNLNNLQLMAFRQSSSDTANALVTNNNTPHLLNEYARDNPQDRRDDEVCLYHSQCL